MKVLRTVKLKIENPPEIIEKNCERFLAACNWISPIVFKTKELNNVSLSKKLYSQIREQFGLTSQLAQSACRTVTASYASMKSNEEWEVAVYKRSTYPVVWKRDFAISKKGVRFWKQPVKLLHPNIPNPLCWRDSKLKKIDDIWYLVLTYELNVNEPKVEGCLVGVDSGIKRLFTATNSSNSKTFTFQGGELNSRRRTIRRTKSQVQAVGTRSSRRLLQRLRHNEAAVTEHLLHVASKRLVAWAESVGSRRIVMENLADIREASLEKGKKFRASVHRWPYAMAQFFVSYKAQAKGIAFELVNPKNTSRGCPCCGHVDKRNRNGLKFRCVLCGFRGDADRVASINIRNRSAFGGHILPNAGTSNSPKSTEPFDIATRTVAGALKALDAVLVVV